MNLSKIQFNAFPNHDERNRDYPMVINPQEQSYMFHNADGWTGNQGTTPHCSAYGGLHWYHSEPKPLGMPNTPIIEPETLYKEIQKNDQWEGEDYDGSSNLGIMKTFKKMGLISSYSWAFTFETVIEKILSDGPVLCQMNWYDGMMKPTNDGRIFPKGNNNGRHISVLTGAMKGNEKVLIKNSWSESWGINGYAYIEFDDLKRLLSEDGDVVYGNKVL